MKMRHPDCSLEQICSLLGKTRWTYYYHLRQAKKVKGTETAVTSEVRTIRLSLPGIGVPKLRHMLRENDSFTHKVPGRNQFYDLLRRHSLLVPRKGRPGPRTTDSYHRLKRYPT